MADLQPDKKVKKMGHTGIIKINGRTGLVPKSLMDFSSCNLVQNVVRAARNLRRLVFVKRCISGSIYQNVQKTQFLNKDSFYKNRRGSNLRKIENTL